MSPEKAPDTPPSSDIETSARLPPSPPPSPKKHASISPVDRLVGIIHLLKAGKLPTTSQNSDWRIFQLSRAQYAEFQRRLLLHQDEAVWGFYQDKVRYDWEPEEDGRFILRMPGAVHERFRLKVEAAIAEGIAGLVLRLRKDGEEPVAGEVGKVYAGGSTTIELHTPELVNSSQEEEEHAVTKRSPDATFYHPSQPGHPTLVVEVGYSQQKKALPRLAESYVVDSRHAVRCVVGLDVVYSPPGKKKKKGGGISKQATISVWRAGVETEDDGEDVGVCRTEVDDVTFRDADGEACEGSLELRLSDLLPPALCSPQAVKDTNLSIPFADLTTYLDEAESSVTSTTPSYLSNANATATTTPKKFRKRKRTPEEEISEKREEAYRRLEQQELEKEGRVDGEFRASGRRRVGEVEVETGEMRRSLRTVRGGGDGAGVEG